MCLWVLLKFTGNLTNQNQKAQIAFKYQQKAIALADLRPNSSIPKLLRDAFPLK